MAKSWSSVLRLITAAAALASLVIPLSAASGEAVIPTEFRFIGSGYGHGVGMSQIGARGQALEGKSAREILSYYYPGTEVTPFPDNTLIRVNIANLVQTVTMQVVGGKGSFSLYPGDIAPTDSPEPIGTYTGDISAIFSNFAGSVIPLLTSPTAKFAPFTPTTAWTVRWDPATVISITNGTSTNQYKYGQIVFKSISTALTNYLAVTNTLRLHDEYLWGLGEVPSSWPAAALEAQAIAARTYALNKMSRLRTECDCNIYNSTVDQNFVGYAKEIEPIYGTKWKEAVARTFVDENSALAVTQSGQLINAFYFSSSGGTTQNIKEVWGSEFAYLQGVPDPWSLDSKINPRYASWSRFVPQATMAQAFGLPNVVAFYITSRTSTGSVATISALASDGKRTTLSGEVFRSRVKLPSTWIYSGWDFQRFRPIKSECTDELITRKVLCLL